MKKTINKKAIEIQNRFFECFNFCIVSGKEQGGLKGFCVRNNFNRTKYATLKSEHEKPLEQRNPHTYKMIDIDALACLIADYGVSSEWLLFGRGKMFV